MPETRTFTNRDQIRIDAFLNEPRLSGETIPDYCMRMAERFGEDIFAKALLYLTNISAQPETAQQSWAEIMLHQERMCAQTGRVVELLTSVVDYYTWVSPNLRTPVAIEADVLDQYRRMMLVDHLTGLYNRRFFSAELEREFQRAKRLQKTMSLLFLDIDHFKIFNDTYGHAAGDKVLAHVASIIKDSARIMDQPARYGGEEFAVILPHTPRADALHVAERLRQTIESSSCKAKSGPHLGCVTVSIGLASFPEDATTPYELVAAADRALYRAKGNGRNQVCDTALEMRQNHRFAINLEAEFRLPDNAGIAHPGMLLDLSQGGAKCSTDTNVESGRHLELTLLNPSASSLTTIAATTRWASPLDNGGFNLGIQFSENTEGVRHFLNNYFKSRDL